MNLKMDTGMEDTKWLTFWFCNLPSIDVYKADRLQEHQKIQQGSEQARVQQRKMVEEAAC